MTYTVYRVRTNIMFHFDTYKPVIRNGKPVTFELEADADQWLIDNPPKSNAEILPEFEVRETIKS